MSAERIDHAAEAAQIAAGGLSGGSFDQTRDYLAVAQVHATLALVEQQRIANLIAYYGAVDEEWNGAKWDEKVLVPIRKGLGL